MKLDKIRYCLGCVKLDQKVFAYPCDGCEPSVRGGTGFVEKKVKLEKCGGK